LCYLAQVVYLCQRRGSIELTAGVSRFVYDFGAKAQRAIFDSLHAGERAEDGESAHRRRNTWLLGELEDGFLKARIQPVTVERNRRTLRRMEDSAPWLELVRETLRRLAPWDIPCLGAPDTNGHQIPEPDYIELRRMATLLHNECLTPLAMQLNLPCPETALKLPAFSLSEAESPRLQSPRRPATEAQGNGRCIAIRYGFGREFRVEVKRPAEFSIPLSTISDCVEVIGIAGGVRTQLAQLLRPLDCDGVRDYNYAGLVRSGRWNLELQAHEGELKISASAESNRLTVAWKPLVAAATIVLLGFVVFIAWQTARVKQPAEKAFIAAAPRLDLDTVVRDVSRTPELRLGAGDRFAVLVVPTPVASLNQQGTFDVVLRQDKPGAQTYRINAVRADDAGRLTLTVPAALLADGLHALDVTESGGPAVTLYFTVKRATASSTAPEKQ